MTCIYLPRCYGVSRTLLTLDQTNDRPIELLGAHEGMRDPTHGPNFVALAQTAARSTHGNDKPDPRFPLEQD